MLDIETSPNIAHVWGLWKQNIGLNQLMETGDVLCWAAKWYGSDEMFFSSVHEDTRPEMVMGIHQLLDEADAVVHYNGKKFDIPTLNTEFVKLGLTPPASYKQIDLLDTVKSNFRFVSNKLQHVAKMFQIGQKVQHEGHELWVKCMADDHDAWERMREYNMGDVDLLERLYEVLLPWLRSPVNQGAYSEGDKQCCPNCGGEHLHKRGYAYTSVSKFQRYQCQDCGAWSRGRQNLIDREKLTVRIT